MTLLDPKSQQFVDQFLLRLWACSVSALPTRATWSSLPVLLTALGVHTVGAQCLQEGGREESSRVLAAPAAPPRAPRLSALGSPPWEGTTHRVTRVPEFMPGYARSSPQASSWHLEVTLCPPTIIHKLYHHSLSFAPALTCEAM